MSIVISAYNLLLSVDGQLTSWSSWSSCTLTCGTGTQERARSCTNPAPQHGGAQCSGSTSENQNCNTHNCPSMETLSFILYRITSVFCRGQLTQWNIYGPRSDKTGRNDITTLRHNIGFYTDVTNARRLYGK